MTTKDFSNTAARAVAWTRQQLGADDLAFLAGLPLKAGVGRELVVVHGGLYPASACATVRLDNEERRMQTFRALIADPSGAHLCAFGHTHRAAVYEFRDGQTALLPEDHIRLRNDAYYLLNPGTVGQPRAGDRRASYMILDLAARTLRLHRVAYDLSVPFAATRRAGLAPAFAFVPAPIRGAMAGGLRALRLERPVRRFAAYLGL
jgi:diadenosine tetraphosphatase ApaH/serine/threonine PP2A family protein phosphatase